AEGREDDAAAAAATPREQRLELDAAGSARVVIDGLADAAIPRRLEVEVEYPDAAGETLAAATRIDLWPSAVVLGIRPDGWPSSPSTPPASRWPIPQSRSRPSGAPSTATASGWSADSIPGNRCAR